MVECACGAFFLPASDDERECSLCRDRRETVPCYSQPRMFHAPTTLCGQGAMFDVR